MSILSFLVGSVLSIIDLVGTSLISLFFPKQKSAFNFHTVPEIIELNGYHCSTHTVTTDDGFQLTLFRVSSLPVETDDDNKPVALLWHGLLDSSYTWIYPGKKSLPFQLCDKGFDVWLGNNRGTKYSCKHAFLKSSQVDMWKFSYDEFVKYDLPNSIDYILSLTGAETLSYVGHSQGTTQFLGLMSMKPEYSKKIDSFTGLGPAASVQNAKGLLKVMAEFKIDQLFWWANFRKQFMPSPQSFLRQFLSLICWLFPFFADDILRILCGKSRTNLPRDKVTEWVEHEPSGTSVMNLVHWAQLIRHSKKNKTLSPFRMFDYGKEENMLRYNQETPLEYPLSKFPENFPVVFFSGTNDTLADPKDVNWLASQIKQAAITVIPVKGFNHTDYLWSEKADDLVFKPTIKFILTNLKQEKEENEEKSDK